MKKSKGVTLGQWEVEVEKLFTEKNIRNLLYDVETEPFYHDDISVKGVTDHIFMIIEDADKSKILVIYPLSKRSKYARLLSYKGYSERLATPEEITSKKHCIPVKNKRVKKDLTTPLFGDLPECRKEV